MDTNLDVVRALNMGGDILGSCVLCVLVLVCADAGLCAFSNA